MPDSVLAIRDKADLNDRVLTAEGHTAVCFCADWCPDCRRFKPVFSRLAEGYDGRLRFATVDVQRCPDLEKEYRIGLIPTVLLFRGGQVVHTWEFVEDPAAYHAVFKDVGGPGA